MTTFSLGDIVFLKSGGPSMTVVQIDSSETPQPVTVGWFVGGNWNSIRLDPDALTTTDPAAATQSATPAPASA